MKERPANSAAEVVFVTVLSAVRTLDPNAVAKVADELCAEHGGVLVAAVLDGVEQRLHEERQTLAAVRAIPPRGIVGHDAPHGKAN